MEPLETRGAAVLRDADSDPKGELLPGEFGSENIHGADDAQDFDLRTLGLWLNEIERELLECWPASLNEKVHARLFALGVTGEGVTGRGLFDWLHFDAVIFLPGDRFEFGRYAGGFGARLAVIIIARNEAGDLCDLIAWDPESGELATWLGCAVLAGAENIFGPRIAQPLIVHESLIEWLRAGRQGVVILDAPRAAQLLRLAEPIGVTRASFGRRLRDSLTIDAPRIVVADRRAAA